MQVGINYPWFDYGSDFGLAPPNWRSVADVPNWRAAVDADLQRFVTLGVTVVRWFVLADGMAYGTHRDAPHPDADPARRAEWRFDPPRLANEVRQHFETLLDRVAAVNGSSGSPRLQLMPVFIDYLFCQVGGYALGEADESLQRTVPVPDWVKGCRADAINVEQKRTDFLDRALRPLLEISQRAPRVVYAWDLMNEPDLVTTGWGPDPRARYPVEEAAMRAFLVAACDMVRGAGHQCTIGFSSERAMARARVTTDIRQFHYYTSPAQPRPLVQQNFSPAAILGEFATSTAEDAWPELDPGNQGIEARLTHAERQGYPLALPWSYRQRDRHSAWNSAVESAITRFTQSRRTAP